MATVQQTIKDAKLYDMAGEELEPGEARQKLEMALWPDGPMCPHCGGEGGWEINGTHTRDGLYKCKVYKCRKQFSVTSGTPLTGTLVPMPKLVRALILYHLTDGEVSARQLKNVVGVTYRTARLLKQRIAVMRLTKEQVDILKRG